MAFARGGPKWNRHRLNVRRERGSEVQGILIGLDDHRMKTVRHVSED